MFFNGSALHSSQVRSYDASPKTPAENQAVDFRPHRLSVRTLPFQGEKGSSTLPGAAMDQYLDISRARDLPNAKDRALYRFFEILPGFLSLSTLFLIGVFSWLKPSWVAYFIILFDLYWTLKVAYLSINQVICFRSMQKYIRVDWQVKLRQIPDWENVYHLIILPMAREGWDVVRETLGTLKSSAYPKDKFIVVLAQEERAGEHRLEIAKLAEQEFGATFYKFLITVHPKDLIGEVIGKGSNTAYAATKAKELVDGLGIAYKNILVSTFDIDTKAFPQYFFCLTYNYLISPNNQRASYQPIPVYHNNIWQASPLTRVVAVSNTFWQMMQQERPEQLVTYSSHSMPAEPFFEVGYPKTVVSDDSRIFWKAFLKYDGNYRVVPLRYPVSMDIVMAENIEKTFLNLYKQQKRWAWGCVEIPFFMFNFVKNKKISLQKKIFYSLAALESFWSWACASLLILLLGWLPLLLGGDKFNITVLSYNLPRLTSTIMIFAMSGMIVGALTNIMFLPPAPKRVGRWKKFSMLWQWLLLPPALIVFGSLPALDAQIRLIFGRYMEFWNTPKIRKD